MKIQGRFIAVLAVLGLLIALLPLAPAGAVTGVVKLTGGADNKGGYFSDQTGNNILTIDVTDADLTPTRIGTARSGTGTGTTINLTTYVIAGEKDETDRFNGGTTNGPCDEAELVGVKGTGNDEAGFEQAGDFPPGSLDALTGDPAVDPTTDNDAVNLLHERCPDIGDGRALVLTAVGAIDTGVTTEAIDSTTGTELNEDQLGLLAYQFKLTKPARDRQSDGQTGVGLNGISDIVSVVVNGRTAQRGNDDNDTAPTNSGPWYTVTTMAAADTEAETETAGIVTAGTTAGGGVTHVLLRRVDPQDVDNSVAVSYRISEFDFAADPVGDDPDPGPSTTPLSLADSSVRYGGDAPADPNPADFAGATSEVTISSVDDTTVITTGDVANATVVTFAYDVKDDSKKELVTLNSGSAGDKKLDAEETSANSDKFQVKVAIFSVADAAVINTEAIDVAGNDATAIRQCDNDGKVEVNELNFTNGLSSAEDALLERSLAARVTAAATALGMADGFCGSTSSQGLSRPATAT